MNPQCPFEFLLSTYNVIRDKHVLEHFENPEDVIKETFNINMGFFNLSWMAKRVIIVDDDVDPSNMDDVEWATWTRMGRAEKVYLFSDFITWEVDRAALSDKTSLFYQQHLLLVMQHS